MICQKGFLSCATPIHEKLLWARKSKRNNFLYNLQKLVCQIIVCFALQCSTVVKKIVPFWLELKVMRTFVRKMMRYFLWLQHFVHDLDLTLYCLLKVTKLSSGMINKSMRRAAVAERTKAQLNRTVFVDHSNGLHLVFAAIQYLSLFRVVN